MKTRALFLIAATAAALASTLPSVATVPATACPEEFDFDSDGDFDAGLPINITIAEGALTLPPPSETAPLPFVYVACSGRGTIVRIDVNTGEVLGEYLTAPDWMGRDPSRTTVDRFGNCWVANRAEWGWAPNPADPQPEPDGWDYRGSVARVALLIGGTRGYKDGDDNFVPDPTGAYVQGPFLFNSCVDRDGDGLIKTSKGLGDVLPWTNADTDLDFVGDDSYGGVTTAEDECIINYTRVSGVGTRTIAVDAENNVWVGGLDDQDHEKLDGVTGLPVPGTQFNVSAGGYGGLIDGNGVLWSARQGGGIRFDPLGLPFPDSINLGLYDGYGLALDPVTGNIWHTTLFGNTVLELDPLTGGILNSWAHGNDTAQGLAVDGSGNVWVAHSLFGLTTVGHLRTDGTYVGNVELGGDGNGPTGVAVDANGKIWVACINSSTAKRIDPAAGPIGGGGFPIGAVDLTVDLNAITWEGLSASPYNYSDMTGFIVVGGTSGAGTWSVNQDGGTAGIGWDKICWEGEAPAGTSVKLEARAADDALGLPGLPFLEIANCAELCAGGGLTGRYLELRVTLKRDPGVEDSPTVTRILLATCPVPDMEPPVPSATSTRIPSGWDVLLKATDNCDPSPDIYVKDSVSGFVAGPYNPDARVQVRVVPSGTPSAVPTIGRYVARLQFKGKAQMYAVDAAGNVSSVVDCW